MKGSGQVKRNIQLIYSPVLLSISQIVVSKIAKYLSKDLKSICLCKLMLLLRCDQSCSILAQNFERSRHFINTVAQ